MLQCFRFSLETNFFCNSPRDERYPALDCSELDQVLRKYCPLTTSAHISSAIYCLHLRFASSLVYWYVVVCEPRANVYISVLTKTRSVNMAAAQRAITVASVQIWQGLSETHWLVLSTGRKRVHEDKRTAALLVDQCFISETDPGVCQLKVPPVN